MDRSAPDWKPDDCNVPNEENMRDVDPNLVSRERCPDTEVEIPEKFTPLPGVLPDPAPVLDPIEPVTITNLEVILTCAALGAGPYGENVTVLAGTFSRRLYLERLLLRPSQHQYLLTLTSLELQSLGAIDATFEQVKALTKLDDARVATWLQEVTNAHAAVASEATQAAIGLINCQYGNAALNLDCPAGAITNDAIPGNIPEDVRVQNPVVIGAGEFLGVTQAQADTAAQESAQSQLGCVFGNEEVTAVCPGDPVPNDEVPLGSQEEPRVGEVVVEADTVFRSSQEDANTAAQEAGEADLKCYYLSEALVVRCTDLDPIWAGAEGEDTLDADAVDATLGLRGNPVKVPAYAFRSDVSQADANEQAYLFALAHLECRWRNAEVTATCEPQTVPQPAGDVIVYPSEEQSPVYTVTVEAGRVASTVSQEDADERASDIARFELDCVYCNPRIGPTCVPEEFETYDPLPIPQELVGSDWSSQALLGVPAGAVCGNDPAQVLVVTDQLNLSTAPAGPPGCDYANDEIRVACVENIAEGILGKFSVEAGVGLSDSSFPSPSGPGGGVFVYAAGTKVISVATSDDLPVGWMLLDEFDEPNPLHVRAKGYVNFLATAEALAQLDCFFESDELSKVCPPFIEGTYLVGREDHSPDVATILEEGFERSPVSKAAANQLAQQYLDLIKTCEYGNDLIPPDEERPEECQGLWLARQGVPQGAFIDTDAARALASALALHNYLQTDSIGGCFDDQVGFGTMLDAAGGGTPGPAGSSGSCAGNCSSYYS